MPSGAAVQQYQFHLQQQKHVVHLQGITNPLRFLPTTHSYCFSPCFQLPTKNCQTAASFPNLQLLSHHPVTTLHRISPSPQNRSSDASNSASRPMASQASRTLPLSPATGTHLAKAPPRSSPVPRFSPQPPDTLQGANRQQAEPPRSR